MSNKKEISGVLQKASQVNGRIYRETKEPQVIILTTEDIINKEEQMYDYYKNNNSIAAYLHLEKIVGWRMYKLLKDYCKWEKIKN